jgi:hypothetical protein
MIALVPPVAMETELFQIAAVSWRMVVDESIA